MEIGDWSVCPKEADYQWGKDPLEQLMVRFDSYRAVSLGNQISRNLVTKSTLVPMDSYGFRWMLFVAGNFGEYGLAPYPCGFQGTSKSIGLLSPVWFRLCRVRLCCAKSPYDAKSSYGNVL
jgi:hypothetical protein